MSSVSRFFAVVLQIALLVVLAAGGVMAWKALSRSDALSSAAIPNRDVSSSAVVRKFDELSSDVSRKYDELTTDMALQGLQRKLGIPLSWRTTPKMPWMPSFIEDWAADRAVSCVKERVAKMFDW